MGWFRARLDDPRAQLDVDAPPELSVVALHR
ncbi:MAG: hypothetical protein ACI9F9_003352 [Candidatus Paceibacteria bacterium]